MAMTKKDYELIARIFHKDITSTHPKVVKNNATVVATAMARQFADVFAKDNDRFDKARFLKACGVEA